MNRSELNEKAKKYLDNAGVGTGTNITLHGAKCLMVDFYLDNQVKNNVGLGDVRSSLPTDDAKFIYSLLPDWVKTKAPEGLDPTFYGTLSKEGDDEIQDRVNKILGNDS